MTVFRRSDECDPHNAFFELKRKAAYKTDQHEIKLNSFTIDATTTRKMSLFYYSVCSKKAVLTLCIKGVLCQANVILVHNHIVHYLQKNTQNAK